MRILFVIDGLPGGGAEKVVITLAEQFLREGEHVSLFSLRDVCEYPLPDNLDYRVIADRCRKPWRKITELTRRARQLDNAIKEAEKEGPFDLWSLISIKPIASSPVAPSLNIAICGSACMASFPLRIWGIAPGSAAGRNSKRSNGFISIVMW